MIKSLIRSYLINLFALWVAAQYIGAFHLSEGLKSLLLIGAGFTLLHLVVRPVISAILGPINFLTLGLIGLVIDAAILFALTLYFPQVSIIPWLFPGLVIDGLIIPAIQFNSATATVLSAFVINIIRQVLSSLAT